MERLLFLDIDGVVNTHMIYSEPIEGRRMVKRMAFILTYAGLMMEEYQMNLQLDG